jgi:Skp family chaperone for outer membrane proteins
MDDDDKQVLHVAAILLAAAVGQTHEPANHKQVVIAVENARKLFAEVKKQHDEANSTGTPDSTR